MLSCRNEFRRFEAAAKDLAGTQHRLLLDILRANRLSHYGERFRFSGIKAADEYRSCVPLTEHAYLHPWIVRIAAGEQGFLTTEPVMLLDPTSGTSGGEKLIPYTASLSQQFRRGLAAWIFNLYSQRPAVRRGRAYWSISPPLARTRRTTGGISIGFDNDAAYLGPLARWAARRLLVSPGKFEPEIELEDFRYRTLLALVAAENLAFISVWHPSFLILLLTELPNYWERLAWDLRAGRLTQDNRSASQRHRRADQLAALPRAQASLAEQLKVLWPSLTVISCWCHANAALALRPLQDLLPHVEIQPKGLLATEGFVSLPLIDQPAPALALRSCFFEFIEMAGTESSSDASCRLLLAHELEIGRNYEVVITTGGGLYRYRLHDKVHVVDRWHDCPLLRFIGKSDCTSDLAGEKLHESHVQAALETVLAARGWSPSFAMVAPVLSEVPGYRLFLQFEAERPDDDCLSRLAIELQTALESNLHYRAAVQLGQLEKLSVVLLEGDRGSASEV